MHGSGAAPATGHGAENTMYKGANLVQKLLLESGDLVAFNRARSMVYGYTSDQGTESHLADVAGVVTDAFDMQEWTSLMQQLREGMAVPGVGAAASAFLFPQALSMADHCHMVFGALQEGTERCSTWSTLESELRAVSAFLREANLRMRFLALCVPNPLDRATLNSRVGKVVGWKWEYLHRFLAQLSPLLPVLERTFVLDKVLGLVKPPDSANISEVTTVVVKKVGAALARPGFRLQVEMLRSITEVMDRIGTWTEGCACHQAWFSGAGDDSSARNRVRDFQRASESCPWKGCRGVEMSLGHLDMMIDRIELARSDAYEEQLARANEADRAAALLFEATLKENLIQALSSKLGFWNKLPYRLLACFGHAAGVCDLACAAQAAATCIEEYEASMLCGMEPGSLHPCRALSFDQQSASSLLGVVVLLCCAQKFA